MTERTISIAIVDDNDLFRDGLKLALEQEENLKIIIEASNGPDFFNQLSPLVPDVVLMDIKLPGENGIELTKNALHLFPEMRVIALTMYCSAEYLKQMMNAGAKGYILKKSGKEIITQAISQVFSGEKYICEELIDYL